MSRKRGAPSNPTGRFETSRYTAPPPEFDLEEQAPLPRTQFFVDESRTVLTENTSPDVGFRFSVNPYRGCEHGCSYCYARPTHEYLGLSAGLDFESKIYVKERAPELLRERLMAPSWKPELISFSGVTDCYQPAERRYRLTRRCLEVVAEFRNPVSVITKNHLVTRDKDLLADLARDGAAAVFVSLTSLSDEVIAKMEPRTSRPGMRLQAIRELSEAGIPVGIMMAPVVPGLTDHEMPAVLEAAARAGARHAGYVPLRLPLTVRPLFLEWLAEAFPLRRDKVVSHIQSLRGGRMNDPRFGSRMRGEGAYAEQFSQMFKVFTRKFGLNQAELELSADAFRRPGEQMRLF
jgi:DNA repair photolyase